MALTSIVSLLLYIFASFDKINLLRCTIAMSFALHRVTAAWNDLGLDPCAKKMLALTRIISQHQYNPQWPCHAWIQAGRWQSTPWFACWHAALMSSLRTSSFSEKDHENQLFSRLCKVARWPESGESLKTIVSVDVWCPFEWWFLGSYMDKKLENPKKMPDLVAMWDPIWALTAPLYIDLGWRDGLKALHTDITNQGKNTVDEIEGSTWWPLD